MRGRMFSSFFPAAVASGFTVDAADFDGTNDHMLRGGAGLTGMSDENLGIFSCWFRIDGGNSASRRIFNGLTAGAIDGSRISLDASNKFLITLSNAAGALIVQLQSTTAYIAGPTWRHLLVSWNGSGLISHMYVNDISDKTILGGPTSGLADWTSINFAIGSGSATGLDRFNGAMAEFYFAPAQFLDFSIIANRRKFISDDGMPVDLGLTGSLPTGVRPMIYLHLSDNEAVSNFALNKGTGGNFSITGSLDSATTAPLNIVDAVDFNGSTAYLTRGGGLTGAADSALVTYAAWVRVDTWTNNARIGLPAANTTGGPTGGGGTGFPGINLDTTGGNGFAFEVAPTGVGNTLVINSGVGKVTGQWYCILASFDMNNSANRFIYVNDVSDLGTVTIYTAGTLDFTRGDFSVGADPDGVNKLDGAIGLLWFNPGTFIDFSVVANRRLFCTPSGRPVDMGSDGSGPTGTAPLAFFRLADGETTNNFATNRGSGGGFTINGSLATHATSPTDFMIDAADFDGTNDFITRGTQLTGVVADGKVMTMVYWVKFDSLTGTRAIFNAMDTGRYVFSGYDTADSNSMLRASNAAGTLILRVVPTVSPGTTGWRCVMISVDLSDITKRHFYFGDTDVSNWNTYTNDDINFTVADWSIGDIPAAGQKLDGGLADFWFDVGTYIDFSVVSNRRKFVDANGRPVYLGPDGSYPTGAVPDIYLHLGNNEASANYAINRGTGGGFTVTGALTTFATSPSD